MEETKISQMIEKFDKEHAIDGKHPIGNESQAGYISPDLVRKINQIYDWIQKQK